MHRGAAANLARVLSDKVWMENYFKPGDVYCLDKMEKTTGPEREK